MATRMHSTSEHVHVRGGSEETPENVVKEIFSKMSFVCFSSVTAYVTTG